MAEKEPAVDIKACPECLREQIEEQMLTGADIVFQTTPLLVFFYRCPLCSHTWSEAHEPVRPASD